MVACLVSGCQFTASDSNYVKLHDMLEHSCLGPVGLSSLITQLSEQLTNETTTKVIILESQGQQNEPEILSFIPKQAFWASDHRLITCSSDLLIQDDVPFPKRPGYNPIQSMRLTPLQFHQ